MFVWVDGIVVGVEYVGVKCYNVWDLFLRILVEWVGVVGFKGIVFEFGRLTGKWFF